MKSLIGVLFVTVSLFFTAPVFAKVGGISAGGPVKLENDVVCTADDLSFEVLVSIGDANQKHSVQVIDLISNQVQVFEARQEESLERDSFLRYASNDGSVAVTRTHTPESDGDMYVGSFSFVSEGASLSKTAKCQVFVQSGN